MAARPLRLEVNRGNVDQIEDESEEGISYAANDVADTGNIPTPVCSDTMATSPCTYYLGPWAESGSVGLCGTSRCTESGRPYPSGSRQLW